MCISRRGHTALKERSALAKNLKVTEAKLEHKTELFKGLQERVKNQEPLFKVGVTIRQRYIERYKQNVINGQYVNARSTANHARIAAGNAAAHKGDFWVDYSLRLLGYLNETGEDVELFGKLYGIVQCSGPIPSINNFAHYGASTEFSETRDLCATLHPSTQTELRGR